LAAPFRRTAIAERTHLFQFGVLVKTLDQRFRSRSRLAMQAISIWTKEEYTSMNASVAFRWLHAEEILLGRKQFETGVSRPARKPGQSVTPRAAGIPIPHRIASGVAA
jgi:hypothetical protein